MNYVVPLIKIVLMVTIVLGDDCPYKECYCDETEIVCSYQTLTAMPQKVLNKSLSLTTLYLDGNQIRTIPAGSLPANLTEISISSNPLETIDDTAFDESIYTLQELSFSEAQFTQIPGAVFHLKALESLQISDTNIFTWNENGMNQLGSTMKTLSLSNIGLKSWPTWMKSMTNLTLLTVSIASMSTIPNDALEMVTNSLTNLDLTNIGLTKLPMSMSKLTVLKFLTLKYNKLIDVTWLPQTSPIITLSLDNNEITHAEKLSNILRPYANTLRQFDIQDNSLTSIPDISFLTMMLSISYEFNHIYDANSGSLPSNLTWLDMNYNLLPSIPSFIKNLKLLSQLSLHTNNIQNVQGSHIPISVLDLDLSSNSISQLTRFSFPHNSSLIVLTLNNNPLTTISLDAFTNIPLLTQLNLESTKLTRLPLALASLTKLNILDVSNSNSLVCTCQEQSLRPWFQSVSFYGIVGDCGMTSVYYFFKVLTLECL